MLKALVDLFLLLSTDKKIITINNMSTFYKFITKKLTEIENQRPSLIISSLNKSKIKEYNNEKFENKEMKAFIFQNDGALNTVSKNITLQKFQNELLSLYYDIIDYLYNENIIILANDKKHILKNRINRILKDIRNNSFENISIQDIKKVETRNYIIELINSNTCYDNFISLNFSIKHFINFFNTKNKDKNRFIAEKFIYIVNPIINIYNTNKKAIYRKKINKAKTKSLSKIPVINIYNNNQMFKEKSVRNKNFNYFIGKKVNYSFNSKMKDKFNLNKIIIKNSKRKTANNKKRLTQKENSKEEKNSTHDTIPGQTLNNCISFKNVQKNGLIDSYLCNNIKSIKTSINKNNNLNIEKLAINEINNFYSNDNIKYFKNKSSLSPHHNIFEKNKKIFIKTNDENYNIEDFVIDSNIKKRKSNLTYESKSQGKFYEKNLPCFIY